MSNRFLSCKKLHIIGYLFISAMNTTWTHHKRHKHNSLTFDSPVSDCSKELQTYSHSNEYSECVKKRHKKHKKKKKHESHERRSPHDEIPLQTETNLPRDPTWWNEPPSLPAGYCLQNVDLHFNLDYNEPILVIPKPKYSSQPASIPKLKRVRLSNKSKASELIAEPKWPNDDHIWLQNANLKPLSPLRDDALELLPTSEDIWSSYEAMKMGGNPNWPLSCLQRESGSSNESVLRTEQQVSKSKETCYKQQLDVAVNSIADYTIPCQVRKEHCMEESAGENKAHYLEFESLELSLDEERGLLDYLKLKRLHAPLADIKTFEILLSMARSEEGREALREMLRTKLVEQLQLKTKYSIKRAAKQKILHESPLKLSVITQEKVINMPESRASPEKATDIMYIFDQIADEELQTPTEFSIVIDQLEQFQPMEQQQPLPQQLEERLDGQLSIKEAASNDRPSIINIEILPTLDLVSTAPDEAAMQEWLQQCSMNMTRAVQSRLEAMPNPVAQPEPIEFNLATSEPVDFETQISQSEQPAHKSQLQSVNLQLNCSATNESFFFNRSEHVHSSNQWEQIYKSRLGAIDDVIKHSTTEYRDPLGKRLRNRCVNESSGQRNLESLKRLIVMPALPSHLDEGLQQIRILRPPVKRKVERTSLHVDTKVVRTYSCLQVNISLNLHMLSIRMENAVYNSEIQVLQKRYEGAQVAWIWNNGSILISNARSKAILAQTQNNLISLILGVACIADLTRHNVLQSNLINIIQFPWQICIDEFSQSYALSTEAVHGNRYAYYVNKSLPSVAAKVYESGAVHVFSMNALQADTMFEKLFLLTANHRKPSKVSPCPSS